MESPEIHSVHQITGRNPLDDVEIVRISSLPAAIYVKREQSWIRSKERIDLVVVDKRTEGVTVVVVVGVGERMGKLRRRDRGAFDGGVLRAVGVVVLVMK